MPISRLAILTATIQTTDRHSMTVSNTTTAATTKATTAGNKASQTLSFLIIGAGMAGILSAIKLKEKGYSQVTVVEKADRIGGTWRENTYPGLTCDVPSHAYTYSFEPNPDWSRHLPPGPEIQQYFEQTTVKYGIDKLIHFNTEIQSCQFDGSKWQLQSVQGSAYEADVVIAATGVLHHPRYPDIHGINAFGGAIFHTSRWDHNVPLDNRSVAVIGNGSTGVQIVSALADRCARILHFQRTAQWIMPVENPYFSAEEKNAFRNDAELLKLMQKHPDYLANVTRFTNGVVNPDSEEMKSIEDTVLANLENNIQDPILKEQLRPNYRAACKRLIFSPDYYQAIQHQNAQLITESIEKIETEGIRTTDGQLHKVDVIALATGYRADQFMRPMNIVGRNQVKLNDVWQRSPRAYYSISIPEFPNLFMLNGPNGPVGNFSLIDIAELQWGYIEQLIEVIQADGSQLCATQQALEQFDEKRIAAAKTTIFGSGCNSWYLNAEGIPATWPWSFAAFEEAMAKPEMNDFELR